MDIATIVEQRYGISQPTCRDLQTPVNDVFEVISPMGHFALKLYNVNSRTWQEVQWELDILCHFQQRGAPVAAPVKGVNGYVETVHVAGEDRVCALFEWAPGQKPPPSRTTYLLLGEAAARIHGAADSFASTFPRERLDLPVLVDEQLERMRPLLDQTGQWRRMMDLADRLQPLILNTNLDTGICHIDLTLDNVHVNGDSLTVFDFDSAPESWRSLEPHGVLRFSQSYFQDWLKGYRNVRQFNDENERAVHVFGLVADIRNVSWKLGLANSSRGALIMQPEELSGVVDSWLQWEREQIVPVFI